MFGQLEKNINSVLIDFEAYDNDLVTSEDVIFFCMNALILMKFMVCFVVMDYLMETACLLTLYNFHRSLY